jgi:hypothetical protein
MSSLRWRAVRNRVAVVSLRMSDEEDERFSTERLEALRAVMYAAGAGEIFERAHQRVRKLQPGAAPFDGFTAVLEVCYRCGRSGLDTGVTYCDSDLIMRTGLALVPTKSTGFALVCRRCLEKAAETT